MAQLLDFTDFFEPVDLSRINSGKKFLSTQFGQKLCINTTQGGWPDMNGVELALIGVNEDRRCINNAGAALAPETVREHFYKLFQGDWNLKMADLGDIRAGHTPEDTDYAVKTVIGSLLKQNILPIIIGGGQDLTYAQYLG